MASSSKKKTTMKKMNRENAVRERQLRKQAKKDARKQAAAGAQDGPATRPPATNGNRGPPVAGQAAAVSTCAPVLPAREDRLDSLASASRG